jgi:hypothetical protein
VPVSTPAAARTGLSYESSKLPNGPSAYGVAMFEGDPAVPCGGSEETLARG